MITNIRKNNMGTTSFDGKFQGMRKAQDFIVYPLKAGEDVSKVEIQSDTRIGYIYLNEAEPSYGNVFMSKPVSSGAFNHHLATGSVIDKLSGEEMLLLKAQIFSSASGRAGLNGIVFVDNSEAISVFGNTEPQKTAQA